MSSSSLSSLTITDEPLINQLNDVYFAVEAKLNGCECVELVENCKKLYRGSKKVIEIAKEYQYNGIQANGYWTYIRLMIKFGKTILSTYHRGKTDEEALLSASHVLVTGLDLCEKFHQGSQVDKDNDPRLSPNLMSPSSVDIIDLLKVFESLTPQLDVIYGNYCAFWLCPSMRRAMQGFTTAMAIYANGSKSSLQERIMACKTLWDSKYKAQIVAHIAHNATVEFVKSFWGLTELSILKSALPYLATKTKLKLIKDVFIQRQKEWIISNKKAQVSRATNSDETQATKIHDSKIRCRLLQSEIENNKNINSIVLHIHGGGFVSQSPDSHEIYLRDWNFKLNGVPILSIDYSLSPEARYPVALQEVLDVYLWLMSKDLSVMETLGFYPEKIVVCGDSAGGNLSAALSLVLNDIRKELNKQECHDGIKANFLLPNGIVCFYTPFMLKTIPSPSRLLTAVDTLLPLGVLLACCEAYAPREENHSSDSQVKNKSAKQIQSKLSLLTPNDGVSEFENDASKLFENASLHFSNSMDDSSDNNQVDMSKSSETDSEFGDFVNITYDDVPPVEDLIFELPNDASNNFSRNFSHTYRRIYDSIIGETGPEPKPWYRVDESSLKEEMKRLNETNSNPYISPLNGPEFDFDDIPLYLVALNYDACLDDSIMLAKKWKGKVVLDVLDELPHGFLNFVILSQEGRRGSDLCISRIQDALV